MPDWQQQYQKDMDYLLGLSNSGSLNSNNSIYVKLKDRSKNLPGLASWLNGLRVNYV